MDRNKHTFEEEIFRLNDSQNHTNWFTLDRIEAYIKKVEAAKSKKTNKTPEDFKILKRYDCVQLGTLKKLILAGCEDPMRFFVPMEDLYSTFKDAHAKCGHGGEKKNV